MQLRFFDYFVALAREKHFARGAYFPFGAGPRVCIGRSFALFEGDRLVFALYLSPEPVLVSRQWAVSLLAHPPERRADALAGRPGLDRPDGGAIVCACFQVGINSIGEAIANGCHTVEAVGAALKAGTNCGSCRSEIRSIIATRLKETAE